MKPRKVWIVKSTWFHLGDLRDCFDYFTSQVKANKCALELCTNEDDGELVETFVYDMEVL